MDRLETAPLLAMAVKRRWVRLWCERTIGLEHWCNRTQVQVGLVADLRINLPEDAFKLALFEYVGRFLAGRPNRALYSSRVWAWRRLDIFY